MVSNCRSFFFSLSLCPYPKSACFQIIKNEEYEEGHDDRFEYWIPANAAKLELFLYASKDEYPQFVFQEDGTTLMDDNFPIKRFEIGIDDPVPERRPFEMRLVYNSNGIDLHYRNPSTGADIKVPIDTTAAPQKEL